MKQVTRQIVRRAAGLPATFGWTSVAREEMLHVALDYLEANLIKGNYAEFGVWRGDTLATCFHLATQKARLRDMMFIAFDSFEGFPALSGTDVHPTFQQGGRAFGRKEFRRLLQQRRVKETQVNDYAGWFRESLAVGGRADAELADGSLSFVWADCDLYESTRDILPFVARKIQPGGIIAFDNWFCFDGDPSRGEQLAVNEFLVSDPRFALVPFHRFGWHGASFIWHRAEASRKGLSSSDGPRAGDTP